MKNHVALLGVFALVFSLASCTLNLPLLSTDTTTTEPVADATTTEPSMDTTTAEPSTNATTTEPSTDTTTTDPEDGGTTTDPEDGGTTTDEPSVHEHDYGDWVVLNYPTATQTGLEERECSCGHKETQVMPVEENVLAYEFEEAYNGYFVVGKGTNKDADLHIPSEYHGYPVVGIGYQAFYMNVYAKSITIPDSVKYIESEAFIYAEGIESVYMPDSVIEIGYGAFRENLSLKTVRLSNSLEVLPDNLFRESKKLETVNIPDAAKIIGVQ